MKEKINKFIFTILLPNIVPTLLLLFCYFAYLTFLYFKDFYHPGLSSRFYGYSQLEKGDFELTIHLDAKPTFEGSDQQLDLAFSSIDISLNPNLNREIDQFCINQLIFAWETFGKVTDPYIVNSVPSCLHFDGAHKQRYESGVVNYRFTRDELFKYYVVSGQASSDTHVLYPFDSSIYKFMAWVEYSVTYSQGEIKQGVYSPFLGFSGMENLLPNNWEVHVWGEKRLVDIVDDEGKVSNVLSKNALDTNYYSISFQRPFVLRFLYISIFITTLGFVLVTFFIKKTDIYLASVLVIIFGLLGIKQLFPLPSDISNNFGLADLLLLMTYILVGISGVNFLINEFVAKNSNPITLAKPRRIRKNGRNL